MLNKIKNTIIKVFHFYLSGFRNMNNWGRQLWIIILVKLFIFFGILRLFFFPDFLATNFESDRNRSDYVIEQITGQDSTKKSEQTNKYNKPK